MAFYELAGATSLSFTTRNGTDEQWVEQCLSDLRQEREQTERTKVRKTAIESHV
jgi:hypothetical protein